MGKFFCSYIQIYKKAARIERLFMLTLKLRLPNIITVVDIRVSLVRINGDLNDLTTRGILELPNRSMHPYLYRKFHPRGLSILLLNLYRNRHRKLLPVLDCYHRSLRLVAVHIFHIRDSLVDLPVVKEPAPPEPVQSLTRSILDSMEEVIGSRMLEGPLMDIISEGIVETILAQNFFAK